MKKLRVFALIIMMACSMSLFFHTDVSASSKAIYTGNTKVDAAVEKIINKACGKKTNLTNKQKLRATYIYLVKHFHYSHKKGHKRVKVSAKDIATFKATLQSVKASTGVKYSKKFKGDWSNVLTLQGTCKDMSGVMCIVANHLGYKAGYVTGRYVRGNGSTCEHWWNYIKINGTKYGCDVQAANDSWKRHHKMSSVLGFYLKKTSSKSWKKHHRW